RRIPFGWQIPVVKGIAAYVQWFKEHVRSTPTFPFASHSRVFLGSFGPAASTTCATFSQRWSNTAGVSLHSWSLRASRRLRPIAAAFFARGAMAPRYRLSRPDRVGSHHHAQQRERVAGLSDVFSGGHQGIRGAVCKPPAGGTSHRRPHRSGPPVQSTRAIFL